MNAASEAPASRGNGFRTFTHENLERAENRINVTLFAVQAIPEFWRRCRRLLGLSRDAWIERIVLDGQSRRPDFRVEGDAVTGWIEVELGDRDEGQLADYNANLGPLRVLSLVGPAANRNGDPSLEAVAELATQVAGQIRTKNRPGEVVLTFLAQMIDDHIQPERRRPFPQDIPQRLLQQPWFARAVAPLRDLGGFVVNRPTNSNSLSLRLRRGPSIRCRDSFALITQANPDHFLLPSPQEMDRIFRGPLKEVVQLYEALLRRVSPCWDAHVDRRHRISIDTKTVETHADEFAAVYAALRDRLIPRGTEGLTTVRTA